MLISDELLWSIPTSQVLFGVGLILCLVLFFLIKDANTLSSRLISISLLLCLVVALVFVNGHATPVYVIKASGPARMLLLGSAVSYTLSNGTVVQVSRISGGLPVGSIVINDGPKPARVETVYYGGAHGGFQQPPARIIYEYHAEQMETGIDYFGPANPPPQSVTVSGGNSTSGTARFWLTW